MRDEILKVPFHGGEIAPSENPLQIVPGDAVVLSDGRPGRSVVIDEIGSTSGDVNPGHFKGAADKCGVRACAGYS
jgi:hypothetical protein